MDIGGHGLLRRFLNTDNATLDISFARVPTRAWWQFVKKNSLPPPFTVRDTFFFADGGVETALGQRHLGKHFWEVLTNFIPVAALTLNAANAVVVLVTKPVHGRNFNASRPNALMASHLGDPSFDQGKFGKEFRVLFPEAVNPVLFVSSKSEHMNIVGLLVRLSDILFQFGCTARALNPNQPTGFLKNIVNILIFFRPQHLNFAAQPTFNVGKEPAVIGVFISEGVAIQDFAEVPVFLNRQLRGNRTSIAARKPRQNPAHWDTALAASSRERQTTDAIWRCIPKYPERQSPPISSQKMIRLPRAYAYPSSIDNPKPLGLEELI